MSSITKQRDTGGIIVSLLLTCIGAYAYQEALNFSYLDQIFPKVFAQILIGCSLAYAAIAMFKGGVRKQVAPMTYPVRGLILILVLIAWSLLLEPWGFIITSLASYILLALLATQNKTITPKHIIVHLAIGVIVVAAFVGLFKYLLDVPLPI